MDITPGLTMPEARAADAVDELHQKGQDADGHPSRAGPDPSARIPLYGDKSGQAGAPRDEARPVPEG